MVRLVDNQPQVQQGRRNSSVLLDFFDSPRFATGLQSYNQGLANASFGEYLVNPITTGAVEQNFLQTRDFVADAQSVVHQSERQMAQNPMTNQLMRPVTRTTQVLASIPAVSGEGAAALRPFLEEVFGRRGVDTWTVPGMPITPNTAFQRQDDAVFAALQAHKFDDPRTEAFRRNAVRAWPDAATAHRGFVDRMLQTLSEDSGITFNPNWQE